MDPGFLHGVWTAALLAVFAAIVAWAWSGRRKREFEEAARLPLEEDAEDDVTVPREQGASDVHRRQASGARIDGPAGAGSPHG